MNLRAAGVLALVLCTGCAAKTGSGTDQAGHASASPATRWASDEGMSALAYTFAREKDARWSSFDSIPGVEWLDQAPRAHAEGRLSRKGRVQLSGFSRALLPNGEVGAQFDTVEGNEGQAGVTLEGDSGAVQILSVRKFHHSPDYLHVLQRQFDRQVEVRLVALSCRNDDSEAGSSVLEVRWPDGTHAVVEAFLEPAGKYSPGYTTFELSRESLQAKLGVMQCGQVGEEA